MPLVTSHSRRSASARSAPISGPKWTRGWSSTVAGPKPGGVTASLIADTRDLGSDGRGCSFDAVAGARQGGRPTCQRGDGAPIVGGQRGFGRQPGSSDTDDIRLRQELWRILGRDAAGGTEQRVREWAMEGSEHAQPACLLRREELELEEAG